MTAQLELLQWQGYPITPGAKRSAPHTSQEAAEAIGQRSRLLRSHVLHMLKTHGPLAPDECALLMHVDRLSIRPRFSELRAQGLIEQSGEYYLNTSGKRAVRWRITGASNG